MNQTWLNQLLNFFWTACCFAGVVVYWLQVPSLRPMYVFIAISIASLLIPVRWYSLRCKPVVYERLGVKIIRRLVQDGDWARAAGSGRPPGQKLVGSRAQAVKYLQTIRLYELYHVVCLVFFTLSALHALWHQHILLGGIIILSNLIYNVAPMLLQQYNRSRIKAMLAKGH